MRAGACNRQASQLFFEEGAGFRFVADPSASCHFEMSPVSIVAWVNNPLAAR